MKNKIDYFNTKVSNKEYLHYLRNKNEYDYEYEYDKIMMEKQYEYEWKK